jgi:hypothetical protein
MSCRTGPPQAQRALARPLGALIGPNSENDTDRAAPVSIATSALAGCAEDASLLAKHGRKLRSTKPASTEPGKDTPHAEKPIDWSQCGDVESVPGKASGAWVIKGTRVPAQAVVDNARAMLRQGNCNRDIRVAP